MDIMNKLEALQRSISYQLGYPVDLYYYEGYGALAVRQGSIFHPFNVVFAFPDVAISGWN